MPQFEPFIGAPPYSLGSGADCDHRGVRRADARNVPSLRLSIETSGRPMGGVDQRRRAPPSVSRTEQGMRPHHDLREMTSLAGSLPDRVRSPGRTAAAARQERC